MNAFFAVSWPASDVLLERLGWVLVHSLWQFTVLGLVTATLLRLLRRSSATARHGCLVLALGAAVATPAATWFLQPLDRSLIPESAAAGELSASGDVSAAAASDKIPLDQFIPIADATSHQRSGATEGPVKVSLPARIVHMLEPWFPWIVGSWCAGVVLCSIRLLIGWRMLRRLRTTGTSEPSQDVREALERVSRRLGLSDAVEVMSSSLAKGPLLIGYCRPVVLLPLSLATSIPVSQLEAILAHELAHVRRHDFLVNLLQTLVETLFFYHPVVWWLSHRLRIEREHCCDDLVVRRLNNRVEYGRALIAIEQLRGGTTSLALGATDGSLLARVRRIVGVTGDREVRWLDRWQGASLSLVSLGVLTLFALTWTAAAQDKADDDVAGPFIAILLGELEVELIGVGFHPSTSENSEGKDWWQPNGRLLPKRPQLSDGGFTVGGSPEAQSRSREFLIQIRGLPQDHSVRTDYGGVSAATGSVFEEGVWTGHHGAGPFEQADTKIRIGIATGPYGPAIGIDLRGRKDQSVQVPPGLKVFYDRVIPVGVTETSGETVLQLDNRPYNELYDLAAWELYAVDQTGAKHRRRSESVPLSGPRELTFALPISEIRRFEYRLRPYRHWAVFDHVSLEPGRTSKVKISVETRTPAKNGRPADRTAQSEAKEGQGSDTNLSHKTVTGRIVDEGDRPVAGARVWWLVVRGHPDTIVEGTSDEQGRFSLSTPDIVPLRPSRVNDTIWVLAPEKQLATADAGTRWNGGGHLRELVIRLKPQTDTSFVVRSPDGKPVAGVQVEPWHFRTHLGYDIVPTEMRERLRATTDTEGRVLMPSMPREGFHSLHASSDTYGVQELRLDWVQTPLVERPIQLRATGRIEGQLHGPVEHIQGVRLLITTEGPPGQGRAMEGVADVTTDNDGRFAVPAIAEGPVRIETLSAADAPVLPRLPDARTVTAGLTESIEVDLEPSVLVRGKIVTDDTETPIPGAEIAVRYGVWRQGAHVLSNDAGNFEARVLPGPVYTHVIVRPREFGSYEQTGAPWDEQVDVPDGVTAFDLPTIRMIPTIPLKGRLVDQNGRPVAKALVNGLSGNRRYAFATTDEKGEFSARVPKTVTIEGYEVGLANSSSNPSVTPTVEQTDPLILRVIVPD